MKKILIMVKYISVIYYTTHIILLVYESTCVTVIVVGLNWKW